MTTQTARSSRAQPFPVPRLSPGRTAAVSVLLLLAAALRIGALDRNSLWRDELETLVQSNRPTLGEVLERMIVSVHPPGHNFIVHYMEAAFGDSEVILRLPSALAGVLAVALLFKIGQVLFSYREGLFAAGFLTLAAAPIYYAQLLRPYSLLLFAALLAMLFWLLLIRALHRGEHPSLPLIVGYIGAAIFASYTHYFGLLLVGLQGAGLYLYALARPRQLGFVLALYLPIAAAFVPWFLAATSYQLGRGPNNLQRRGPRVLVEYFEWLFNESTALAILFALLMVTMTAAVVWGHRRARLRQSEAQPWPIPPELFTAIWLLLPVLLAFAVSQVWNPIFRDRSLIMSLPAAYLLLARGVTVLPVRWAGQYVAAGGLALLFALNLLFTVQYYAQPQTPEIREAVRYIVRNSEPGEDALIVGFRTDWYDYYFRREATRERVDLVVRRDEEDAGRVLEAVQEGGYRTVWLMSGVRNDPGTRFLRAMEEHFELVEHKSWRWADVWRYRVPEE